MSPKLIGKGQLLPCLMFAIGGDLAGFRDCECISHILVWRFREDGHELAAVVRFLMN